MYDRQTVSLACEKPVLLSYAIGAEGREPGKVAATSIIERTAAPLRQQVVKLIREDILNGNFSAGERLVEGTLCDAYGVSRTVVREALRQLETEHLIRMLPSKGPIVAVLTASEIRALYVVRASLEGLMGQLFALNASDATAAALAALRDRIEPDYRHGSIASREEWKADFYRLLLQGAGNEVLIEVLHSIHARIAIFRRFAFVDESRVAVSIDEVSTIIDAALRRDPKATSDACAHHIVHAGELAIIEYEKRTPAGRE